jgi:hypothetical protein
MKDKMARLVRPRLIAQLVARRRERAPAIIFREMAELYGTEKLL